MNDYIEEFNKRHRVTDIIKLIISGISIFLLSQFLFGKSHDVLSFYRSLFFLSYPILFDISEDIIRIADMYKQKIDSKKLDFGLLIIGLITSASCFCFTLIVQVANNEFPRLYNHVHYSNDWEYGIILFVVFIICYLAYPVKNIVWPLFLHRPRIKTEERPT